MDNTKIYNVITRLDKSSDQILSTFPVILEKTNNSQQWINDHCGNNNTTEVLDIVSDDMSKINKELEALFIFLKDNLDKIELFTKQIQEIRQNVLNIKSLSEDLKIYSLNSMVVAIKAGKSGGGFSYITQELRIIADHTISQSEILAENANIIQNDFQSMKIKLKETDDKTNTLISTLNSELGEIIKRVNNTTIEIEESLNKETQCFNNIKEFVLSAMESMQSQDIIKQSLEQIITSTEKLNSLNSGNMDGRDFLSISNDLNKTSLIIVKDVKQKLFKSTEKLRIKSDEIELEISKINSLQYGLNEKLYKSLGHLQPEIMAESYSNNFLVIKTLIGDVNTLTYDIKNKFSEILKSLSSFPSKVDQLGNINIAARIEISKYSALEIIMGTVQDMVNLKVVIEKDILSSIEGSYKLNESLSIITEKIQEFNDDEKSLRLIFNKNIQKNSNDIDAVFKEFQASSSHLKDETDKLKDLFSVINSNLSEMENTCSFLQTVETEIENESNESEQKFQTMLNSEGVKYWNLKDDALVAIINKFTIYTHKAAAAEVSQLTIDDDILEQGEVELF